MFDEMNARAQCWKCNRFMEGDHFLYRKWLVKKHDGKMVEKLDLIIGFDLFFKYEAASKSQVLQQPLKPQFCRAKARL